MCNSKEDIGEDWWLYMAKAAHTIRKHVHHESTRAPKLKIPNSRFERPLGYTVCPHLMFETRRARENVARSKTLTERMLAAVSLGLASRHLLILDRSACLHDTSDSRP